MLHATCHICNRNTTERHESFGCDYKLQLKQNNLNKIEAADAERAQCRCVCVCVNVCSLWIIQQGNCRDQATKQPSRQIKSNSYIMRINRRGYIAHTPHWPQNAQLLTSLAQLDGHQYAHCAQRQQIVERSRIHIPVRVSYRVCISTRIYRLPVCGTYASNSPAYPHACCSGYNADLSRADTDR